VLWTQNATLVTGEAEEGAYVGTGSVPPGGAVGDALGEAFGDVFGDVFALGVACATGVPVVGRVFR
jgi:hypothetical protein